MLRRLKSHIIFIFTWLKSYVDQMLTLKIFCNRLRINSYRQTEITFGRVFMLRRLKNLLISFSKVEIHCSLIWVRKFKSDDSSTLFCFSVCKVHIFWEGHKILQNLWRFDLFLTSESLIFFWGCFESKAQGINNMIEERVSGIPR